MSLAPTLTERDREASIERSQSTYSELFGSLYAALVQCDPGRLVNETPAHDCVYDEMAGRDADETRSRITYLIGLVASGQGGTPETHEMALKLCNDLAHGFADYRAGL
jgi:hypothetical protein